MRIIFDHRNRLPARDCHDCVHFAADTRVMHNTNRLGARGHALFDLALINV